MCRAGRADLRTSAEAGIDVLRYTSVVSHRRSRVLLAWGVMIVALVVWIRFAVPQSHSRLLAVLVGSEPFHVLAHSVLYGALAWLAARRFGDRVAWVLGCVLAVGFVQEMAQVVGMRAFGGPELYDLGVDEVAAIAVIGVRRLVTAASTP
jgi:hypothetical protein